MESRTFYSKIQQQKSFLVGGNLAHLHFINNFHTFKFMEHEPHIAKPKIAKNASSKLPDVFRFPASSSKRVHEVEEKHHPYPQSEPKPQELKDKEKDELRKARKSRNPFLPVKQFMKLAGDFNNAVKITVDDINKLLEQRNLYKYQNCITLSVVRRNASSCLKKVFHVPTLSVHFLRESLISTHFDKGELETWIDVINHKESGTCIKILKLFWNMPEDYYSLLYEYSQGLLLDSLNDSLHTLPLPLIRDIAQAHLSSFVDIYNSQLILAEESGAKAIKYLPIYEESDQMLENKKLKDIAAVEVGNDETSMEGRFVWRLGVVLLGEYLGSVVAGQDLERISLPLRRCCLLHEMLALNGSLSALFLSLNNTEDEALTDFLCRCLRSRSKAGQQGRSDPRALRGHRFLQRKYGEIISLGEMIEVVDPSSEYKSKFEISKMNKIMDSVSSILQNVSKVTPTITAQNAEVQWLAKELGMAQEIDKVVGQLKKVYKETKNE